MKHQQELHVAKVAVNTLAEVCPRGWEILHVKEEPLLRGYPVHEPGTRRKWNLSQNYKNLLVLDL
jgi:hypothetical protein